MPDPAPCPKCGKFVSLNVDPAWQAKGCTCPTFGDRVGQWAAGIFLAAMIVWFIVGVLK